MKSSTIKSRKNRPSLAQQYHKNTPILSRNEIVAVAPKKNMLSQVEKNNTNQVVISETATNMSLYLITNSDHHELLSNHNQNQSQSN
jgi:hypothetical protein